MKRILGFAVIALIPVIILAVLFPEKAFEKPLMEERYHSVQGADIVAFVRDGCPHCAAFEAYAVKEGWDIEFHEITQPDSHKLF